MLLCDAQLLVCLDKAGAPEGTEWARKRLLCGACDGLDGGDCEGA